MPGGDRLSQPQAAQESEHLLLSSDHAAHAWGAARGIGGARFVQCRQRALRRLLGIQSQSLGHGCGSAHRGRSRRQGQPFRWIGRFRSTAARRWRPMGWCTMLLLHEFQEIFAGRGLTPLPDPASTKNSKHEGHEVSRRKNVENRRSHGNIRHESDYSIFHDECAAVVGSDHSRCRVCEGARCSLRAVLREMEGRADCRFERELAVACRTVLAQAGSEHFRQRSCRMRSCFRRVRPTRASSI